MQAYERGGAAALSVLTEPFHFGGSLDDLREARAAPTLPVLRKDFIVDPYQLYEAAAAGADAILLIVAALERRRRSTSCCSEARALDLDALVEVHDERELERGARGRGRRARHQQPRPRRLHASTSSAPTSCSPTSRRARPSSRESGFSTREQLDELERVGVDAVLIGETLMRAAGHRGGRAASSPAAATLP